MKKIGFLFLFAFALSCQPKEEVGVKFKLDYRQIIKDYNSVFEEAFDQVGKAKMVSTVSISATSRVLRLNRKETQIVTAGFLSTKGFSNIESNGPSNAVAILQSGVIHNPTLILNSVNRMIDTSKIFSGEHRRFMKLFVTDMSDVQDEKDGYRIIDSFNNQIISSELLNDGEKIQLLLFGSQSYALLNFYNGEGSSTIFQSIKKEARVKEGSNAAANARVESSCKVNWRSVWGGAVLGGIGGGIRGAIIGGTGGTVALPGVGTVTGAVSGGVFGFAQGFVSGAAYGVAQELMLSCFSTIMSQDVLCRQFWERWERGEITIEHVPTECWPDFDITDFTMNPS